MLSADEKAVRRVLGAIEAMLIGRAGCPPGPECEGCERGGRYALPAEPLAQARAYVETAADNIDRALEQIEFAQVAALNITAPPRPGPPA